MSDEVKRSPYHRTVPVAKVDVYRILSAFEVADPCFQHAIKKLLVAGRRLGGKSIDQDVAEAIWTLQRWQEMRREDTCPFAPPVTASRGSAGTGVERDQQPPAQQPESRLPNDDDS